MIYCVVPPELADELYDKLVDHYRNNSNVEVIIDRRKAERRSRESDAEHANLREQRDRRRQRPGSFPIIEAP